MIKALDETRPQEPLGVVDWGRDEPRDSDREVKDPERGSREKVLVSGLMLMTLFERRDEGGRGDEARLLDVMLASSASCA